MEYNVLDADSLLVTLPTRESTLIGLNFRCAGLPIGPMGFAQFIGL
jgi:hypothetical protein